MRLWDFRPEAVRTMGKEHENREFLPGYPFPPTLEPTEDLTEAVQDCELVIMVVPSHVMRATAARLPAMPAGAVVVSATKGIEERTLMRMSEVLADVWKESYDPGRIVCLSGPSLAGEVIRGVPTSVVAASVNLNAARWVQEIMSDERFRVYAHDDLPGVEYGGSLKNVIAIAAGISAGLGFGDNTLGALLTRGMAEISRLGSKLGGRPATFAGLSGMGDLVTTCTSPQSRNRYVGYELGRGRKLPEILAGMNMVAEGVRTTASAWELACREEVDMPITRQVHRILFEGADPRVATTELMTRKLKVED